MSASQDSADEIARLLAAYRATCYKVAAAGSGEVALRIGEPLPAGLSGWLGRNAEAFFLGAANPCSVALPAAENARRHETLRQRLGVLGAIWLEGVGAAPDGRWREAGFLLACIGVDEADRLAREFDQNALVRWLHRSPARLRLYRADWRPMVADADDLEWAAAPITSTPCYSS